MEGDESSELDERWDEFFLHKDREIERHVSMKRLGESIRSKWKRLGELSDNATRVLNINDGTFNEFGVCVSGYHSCRSDPVYQKLEEVSLGLSRHGYSYPGATGTYAGETHSNLIGTVAYLMQKIVYRQMKEREYEFLLNRSHAEIVDSIVRKERLCA
ncbi:MAG: hypothetical protein HYW25_04320 [Candidatus Aenigmarchaeota archaeon]|nr:hypothetical protein [Candidatus Aenigmarchaeota archaeon]